MKRDKEFIPKLYIVAFVNVYLCFGIMSYYTLSFENYDLYDKYYNLEPGAELLDSSDRAMLCNVNITNHNMVFEKPSPTYFNSIYDNGHIRFFEENDMLYHDGTFRFLSIHERELMDVLAVRYFYDVPNSGGTIVRMTYLCEDYPYIIYENDSYIPMGTTYDLMISHEDFAKLSEDEKHRVYAKYLVADDPAEFADILEIYSGDLTISDEEYEKQIALRQENAALSTEQVRDGYVSQLELDSEELVFYSISYNDSWKAYIDGEEADVYEVNNGLVGVRVPEGRHEVKLSYSVKGAGAGMLIFGAGAASLAVYLYICKRKSQVSE